MQKTKRLRICLIPEGRGPVRTLRLPVWFLPVAAITTLAVIGGLGIFSCHSYRLLASYNDQAAELETARYRNATQEQQLGVFAERVGVLGRKVAELSAHEADVNALAGAFNRQMGLDENAPVAELAPRLGRVTAWAAENRNGVGGGEALVKTGQAGLEDLSRETIKGMHRDLDRLMLAAEEAENHLAALKDGLASASSILAATPLTLPVAGRISSDFGYRRSPFGGRSSDFHQGLDLPAPIGTPIYAPADGTVLSADQSRNGYGLLVTLDHGYGLVTRYAHLSKSLVEAGDEVKRGEKIALVGNSGRSTGPHLHYETILAGVPIDPMKFTLMMAARNKSPAGDVH